MIRKTTLWALRALLYLAGLPEGQLALAAEVARAVGAPAFTTAKVLQRLCLAGIIVSQRGVRGGYLLAEPPASIGFMRVLRAMQDPLAEAAATPEPPAFAHLGALLADAQTRALERLEPLTVADLFSDCGDGQ